jgi:hypothetical protein
MNDTELKACPFCGAKGEMINTVTGKFIAQCSSSRCGTYPATAILDSKEEAASDWNKRAGDREPAATQTPEPSTLASARGSAAGVTEAQRPSMESVQNLLLKIAKQQQRIQELEALLKQCQCWEHVR